MQVLAGLLWNVPNEVNVMWVMSVLTVAVRPLVAVLLVLVEPASSVMWIISASP